jgi:hypothetical protein
MKTAILILSLWVAGNVWATCDTITDTIEIHSVKQIDDHLLVQDTVIIQQVIHEVKKQLIEGDNSQHVIEILVVLLVALSVINHYLKNKRNG